MGGGGAGPAPAPPPAPGPATSRRVLIGLAALALALGAGVSGCGDRSAATDSRPALGALPHVRSQADLVLPMDHYLPSPRDRAVLATARSELTAQCMARLGFTGYPVDSFAAQTEVPLHGNDFGVLDEANARRFGFKASFEQPLLAQSDDISRRFAAWGSPEVRAALQGSSARPTAVAGQRVPAAAGIPEGGCQAEGPRELYGFVGARVPPDLGWMDTLAATAFGAATQDPRLAPVTAAWSRCMKEAGYDYATPGDSNSDPRWDDGNGGGDIAGGKRAALADVHCKWSSGYLDTYVALVGAYERQVVEQNAERLQDGLDLRQRLLAAAAAHGLGRIRAVGEN